MHNIISICKFILQYEQEKYLMVLWMGFSTEE